MHTTHSVPHTAKPKKSSGITPYAFTTSPVEHSQRSEVASAPGDVAEHELDTMMVCVPRRAS